MAQLSKITKSWDARTAAGWTSGHLSAPEVNQYTADGSLELLGLDLPAHFGADLHDVYTSDGLDAPLTSPSIPTPVQFLQAWVPGYVGVMTKARTADTLLGMDVVGSWADEEVVIGQIEATGQPRPYSDHGNTQLTSWNTNYERFSIVRFEMGFRYGILESERASRIKIDSAASKRRAAGEALEILRNSVAFNGYLGGANRTYGFLNAPGLPAYVTVPNGAGGNPEWSSKTMTEIISDIETAISALITRAGGRFNPETDDFTIALSLSAKSKLTKGNDFGRTAMLWLKENYPRARVVGATELDGVNAGENVMIVYAEGVRDDISTDNGKTFMQMVPAKMRPLGVARVIKGVEEAVSNALAGVVCKRPLLVVRYSDI